MKKEYDFEKINAALLRIIIIVVTLFLVELLFAQIILHTKSDKRNLQLINSDVIKLESKILFLDYCDSCLNVVERDKDVFEEDMNHIVFDNYDSIHLSMWNTPRLDDGTYETFWGKTIYYPQHNCTNPQELYEYLLAFSRNELTAEKVYLSIDPYELYNDYYRSTFYDSEVVPYEEYISNTMFQIFEENPGTDFVIILPVFSVEYLESIGDEIDDIISSWYTFAMLLHWCDNVSVQYMGLEEWLVANSSNFISKYELVEDVGKLAITYIYSEDKYGVTPPELLNIKENVSLMTQHRKAISTESLKEKKIVFYGDSLFDYYKQSTLSIPGIVYDITGADCYNLSIGGTTASQLQELSFSEVAASGVGRDGERFEKECKPGDDIIFVILYGINDYLIEASIEEVAVGLFNGAEALITEYPNSKLVFVSPYRISGYETEIEYKRYVDAIRDVSRGYHSRFVNLYEDIVISEENERDMIVDGIHPTLTLNIEIAEAIVNKLVEQ